MGRLPSSVNVQHGHRTKSGRPEPIAPSSGHDRTVVIRQVDAFTDVPHTGNPAGVVTRADGLTDVQMQSIAREMALSETVFVLSPTLPSADLRIRWFTPKCEVRLCGHATIAAFHALAEDGMSGMDRVGSHRFTVETLSGVLPVTVERSPDSVEVFMGLPVPVFERVTHLKLDLLRILHINMEDFESKLPLVRDEENLYVPIKRLHTVFGLKPDLQVLSSFLQQRTLTGLCVFTTETLERRSHVHSRLFAPNVGIPEDPVTGSANGPLGAYLAAFTKVASGRTSIALIGEQGDVLGRRGRVAIRLALNESGVTTIEIGGVAVTVMSGEMLLP